MAKATKTFTSTLDRFDGNLWYYYLPVPAAIANQFITGKDRRVVCTLNQTAVFQAALMPLGDGNFFVNVNKTIRTKLKLQLGSDVQVLLQKDTSEYGLPVPEEFTELLKQDEEGSKRFHSLTPGKQRTLLYIVAKPKSSDLKIRNGMVILEHLKRTNGVIHFKQLNEEMKQS